MNQQRCLSATAHIEIAKLRLSKTLYKLKPRMERGLTFGGSIVMVALCRWLFHGKSIHGPMDENRMYSDFRKPIWATNSGTSGTQNDVMGFSKHRLTPKLFSTGLEWLECCGNEQTPCQSAKQINTPELRSVQNWNPERPMFQKHHLFQVPKFLIPPSGERLGRFVSEKWSFHVEKYGEVM